MDTIFQKTKELFDYINDKCENKNEYRIISDFGKSSILSDPVFGTNTFFRIFTPVKPSKGRKLNSLYGESFNPYKDSLMDYPTIVQHKLGKVGNVPWENYNRLISVHISRCPLNCWHCYVDDCLKSSCEYCMAQQFCDQKQRKNLELKESCISGYDLVDSFIKQRESDYENGVHSNILRVTGGEPFLAPQLLLDILEEFDKRDLQNDTFLWTETNLIPLATLINKTPLISDELLNKLGNYDNFLVHPCFHGIDESSFEENTGEKIKSFDLLINALKRLIDSGIDVYPTFGSNVNDPDKIDEFYQKMSEINKLLPLRFALIEYDLDYKPIKRRRELIPDFAHRHRTVYNRFQIIERWDNLLRKNTGYGYGQIPRHLIPLEYQENKVDFIPLAQKKNGNEVVETKDVNKTQVSTDVLSPDLYEFKVGVLSNEKLIHFFHWPVYGEYQERMLNIIALPEGAGGEISFDKKWIHEDIIELINLSKEENKDYYAIFWGLSCEQIENSNKTKFLFACPIRILKINDFDFKSETNRFKFQFIADRFFSQFRKYEIEELKKLLSTGIGNQHPLPCNEKGLVHVTPKIIDMDDKYNFSEKPSLALLYKILEDIPCKSSQKDAIPISNYPLIYIDNIEGAIIGADGIHTIKYKQTYKIKFSWYQGDKYRNRKPHLKLNRESLKLKGKTEDEYISLIETNKGNKLIELEVEGTDFDYTVRIYESVVVPFLNLTPPNSYVIIASILAIIGIFLLTSEWDVRFSGTIPLLIVIFEAYIRSQEN